MSMSQIRRQMGETLLDIQAVTVPAQQRADRESVPEVMQARAKGIGGAAQADLSGQLDKGSLEGVLRNSGTAFGHEEGRIARARAEPIAFPGICC